MEVVYALWIWSKYNMDPKSSVSFAVNAYKNTMQYKENYLQILMIMILCILRKICKQG